MAEEIVACPSCGKKFRIPEGAPPGSFKCTACNADVAYGAPAVAPAAGGPPPGGVRRGGGRPTKTGRKSRGARRGKARRSRAEEGGESAADRRAAREAKQTEKSSNTGAIVAAIMGGLAVIVLLVLALTKKDKAAEPETGDGDASALTDGLDGSDVAQGTTGGGKEPAGDAPSTEPTKDPDYADDDDDDDGDSGIGGAGRRPSSSQVFRMPKEKLFVDYPFLDDTPESQRNEIRSLVAALVDRNSGRKGAQAQNTLEKMGKPAVPALLSTWSGRTWEGEDDQLATDIVQRVLRQIVKDDGPKSDFHARFVPHEPIEAAKFERAGRMWISWWLSKGIDMEKFSYVDDEDE